MRYSRPADAYRLAVTRHEDPRLNSRAKIRAAPFCNVNGRKSRHRDPNRRETRES